MYYAAQDLLEYLMTTTGGGAQDAEHRALRAAAYHAYRDVAYAKDWLWYVTESRLRGGPTDIVAGPVTFPSNTAGSAAVTEFSVIQDIPQTITYTLESGQADNAAFSIAGNVLSTGSGFTMSKPVWLVRVRATDESGYYIIKDFTLERNVSVAAGDAQANAQSEKIFLLPPNVNNVDALIPPDRVSVTAYITPAEWRRLESYPLSAGDPIYYTLVKCPLLPDRWQLQLAGSPPSGTFYFTYRRKPKPLRFLGYETRCRDHSLDSTPGLVKRYGTAANHPEGASGIFAWTCQEIIGVVDQTGGNPTRIGSPPANAKTVVSDYIDMSENMFTALLSCAEMWLARLLGKDVSGALAVYQRDLKIAMENDVIAPISGRRLGTDRYPELISPPYAGTARQAGYYSPSGKDTGT